MRLSSFVPSVTLHNNDRVERERELCPAFLIEDFEAAAREADAAVMRLRELAADVSPANLTARPEWGQAQRAIQWEFRARAALEQTGLPLPPEALAAAERARSGLLALGTSLAREEDRT